MESISVDTLILWSAHPRPSPFALCLLVRAFASSFRCSLFVVLARISIGRLNQIGILLFQIYLELTSSRRTRKCKKGADDGGYCTWPM